MHKKTPKYDFDDLFVDDLFEADLFAPPVQKITQNEVIAEAQKLSSMSINPEGSKTGRRRLSARSIAVKRAALINKHIYFLKPRLGSTPSVHPNIRPRTWLTMMQLAKDGDDMKKILELIPILHEGGGALPSVFAEEFVREWHHFFTLKAILTLIFRSLRETKLPTSCPRGIRRLCKIQHHPNSGRGTLANPLRPRPPSTQRSYHRCLAVFRIQPLPC